MSRVRVACSATSLRLRYACIVGVMSARAVLFYVASAVAIAGMSLVASGCDPSRERPAHPPKAPLPPDRTEVTMEISSAAPPGEPPPAPRESTPASTKTEATDGSDDPMIGGVQPDAIVEKA